MQNLIYNPVTIKELRGRMRGRRAFVLLTGHVLLMSAFVWLIYLAYAAAANSPYGPDANQAGKVVAAAVLTIQVFLVVFIGPAFTAGAISGEKERKTYDLLQTTLLPAHALVMGKLLSALSYVLLLILAAVPLQSIAFLLGGLALSELIVSQLLVMVAAVLFALLGLFFSSLMRSTIAASVITYTSALFLTVGVPLIAMIALSFLGPFLFGSGSVPDVMQVFLIYAGLLLAATNLPAALLTSEIILLEEGTLWAYKTTIGSYTVWVLSPWYLNLLLYALLATLLYWGTVRRVRRVADK